MNHWIPLSLCLTLAAAGGPAFAARSLAVTELASTVTCYNGDSDRVYANATPYNPSSIRCRDFASGNDWNAFAVSRTTVPDPDYPTVRMYVNAALLADDNGEGAGEFQAGHFDYSYRLDVTALPEESWRLSSYMRLGGVLGFWNETGGTNAQHGGYGSPTDVRVLVDGVEFMRLADYDVNYANYNLGFGLYGSEESWGPIYSGSRSFTVRVAGSLEAYSNGDEVAVLLGIDDLSNGLDTADDYDTWNRDPDHDELYVGIAVSTVPVCGNGHLEDGWVSDTTYVSEACDDGNLVAGDGCSATCEIEPCADGTDDDGDGLADFPDDPGCVDAVDLDEHDPTLPCDDGADVDGDGRADYSANPAVSDPGCKAPTSTTESPQCQDGKNNDNQSGIDFDGGASLDLDPQDGFIDVEFNPSTPPVGAADPQCTAAWRVREKPAGTCGIGFELALVLPLLEGLRRRVRRGEGGRAR
jgi:cysteine-rich repeat protein